MAHPFAGFLAFSTFIDSRQWIQIPKTSEVRGWLPASAVDRLRQLLSADPALDTTAVQDHLKANIARPAALSPRPGLADVALPGRGGGGTVHPRRGDEWSHILVLILLSMLMLVAKNNNDPSTPWKWEESVSGADG